MHWRQVLTAGLLLATAPAVLADGPQTNQWITDAGVLPPLLDARISTVAKPAYVSKPRNVESRMIVKFRDSARMRTAGDGGQLMSETGTPVANINDLASELGVSFSPVIDIPQNVLTAVENRAARYSRREQPDLGGIMVVETPAGSRRAIERIANRLNSLAEVEYVEFQMDPVDHGGTSTAATMTRALLSTTSVAMGPKATVPNLVAAQGYLVVDPFGGFEVSWAEFVGSELNRLGTVDPFWNTNLNGGLGATVKIGVVEGGAAVEPLYGVHVDLEHVTLEPGQTLLPEFIEEIDHGSATLGEIAARDHGIPGADLRVLGDNREVGCIGMCRDVEPWFFPTRSVQSPGGRLSAAIVSAIAFFDRGDVLSFSIGFPNQGPLVTSPTIAVLIRAAADTGITCVMSAGNDCLNLDDADYPATDHGGIVVGAGLPEIAGLPAPFPRLGFSNHFWDEAGRVDTQAWGANVTTLGYGDAFQAGRSPYTSTGSPRFRYTSSFGGTSSAAPMVAANCALLQGLAKQFFGVGLAPEQIRSVAASGYIQENQPDIDLISGTEDPPDGDPCDIATYMQDPDIDGDLIGNHGEWRLMSQELLGGEWFPANNDIVDLAIFRGRLLYGSRAALLTFDNNPLIVQSQFGTTGNGTAVPGFPTPFYFFTGDMTDIGVKFQLDRPGNVITMNAQATLDFLGDGLGIVGIEAHNWNANRWDFVASGALDTGPSWELVDGALRPGHLDRNTGHVVVRVWVYRIGFGEGSFVTMYDQVDIVTTTGGIGGGIGGG